MGLPHTMKSTKVLNPRPNMQWHFRGSRAYHNVDSAYCFRWKGRDTRLTRYCIMWLAQLVIRYGNTDKTARGANCLACPFVLAGIVIHVCTRYRTCMSARDTCAINGVPRTCELFRLLFTPYLSNAVVSGYTPHLNLQQR